MIGILGGTFDPVHLGHCHIAKALLEQLPLEEIRFLPCYTPVHREAPMATPEQRLAMLELAIANEEKLVIDLRELHRQGESFMIDTLKSLRAEMPDAPLALIVGADSFEHIQTWHHWQELIDYAHFIVVDRPESEPVTPTDWAEKVIEEPESLPQSPSGLIYFAHLPTSPASASEIRHKIADGEDIKDYLPPAVWGYIQEHGLYSTSSESIPD